MSDLLKWIGGLLGAVGGGGLLGILANRRKVRAETGEIDATTAEIGAKATKVIAEAATDVIRETRADNALLRVDILALREQQQRDHNLITSLQRDVARLKGQLLAAGLVPVVNGD